MSSVRYSPRALREADELLRYIERQNPMIAGAVSAAIEEVLHRIAHDPRLATLTDTRGVRKYPIRKYGVTLYVRHRPRKQVLEVVRVVRGKRVKALAKMP